MKVSSAAILLTALFMMGCGSGKPETVPASGKVVFNKSTAPVGALVVFHPTDPNLEKKIGGKPFGRVQEDGSFKLSTYGEDDGAPEGEYGVTVDWRGNPKANGNKKGISLTTGDEESRGSSAGPPRLKPQFSNPQQPFMKVTVKKGDVNEFTFDVN